MDYTDFIQLYVSASAGGGGAGTEGDPLTLAEAFADTTAGPIVYHIKAGSYSSGAVTIATAGSNTAPRLFMGYSTTPGDLWANGYNTYGWLDTTNFPEITMSGSLTPANYLSFINLKIVGSIAGGLVLTSNYTRFKRCYIENTADAIGTAYALYVGTGAIVKDCDLITSGSNSYRVMYASQQCVISKNRVMSSSATAVNNSILTFRHSSVRNNVVIGNGTSPGILCLGSTLFPLDVEDNTIYNCTDPIQLPNASVTYPVDIDGNHITDCTGGINNLYSGTSNISIMALNNRTRDNGSNAGLVAPIELGEVTTDTGGAATDYTDVANGDLTLISGAPGVGTNIGYGTWNIGASQNEYSSTGGIIRIGLSGGING